MPRPLAAFLNDPSFRYRHAALIHAVRVAIGIAIALAMAAALPLYAVTFWRFGMAEALNRCAALLKAPDRTEASAATGFETISPVLQNLRGLMAPVARKTGLPMAHLEAIQRSLRLSLSLMELATGPQTPASGTPLPDSRLTTPEANRLASRLEAIAGGLESGAWALPWEEAHPARNLAARQIDAELGQLRAHLLTAPALWVH